MGKLEDIDRLIAGKLAEIDRKFKDMGVGASGQSADTSADTAPVSSSDDKNIRCLMRSALPATASRSKNSMDYAPLWQTSQAELEQLMLYVSSSPHVVSNAQYAKVAKSIVFDVADNDPAVNAYATVENNKFTVRLLGGAIRYSKIVAAAYVGCENLKNRSMGNGRELAKVIEALGDWLQSVDYEIDDKKLCAFTDSYGLNWVVADDSLSRRMRSLSAALLIGILAHEVGHLALGHLYGRSVNLEISRNQEREADSFASSVISSSPFGDQLVLGTILWELVWVWQEKQGGMVATTHPLSSERLADLIRANPSSASELGIDLDGMLAKR